LTKIILRKKQKEKEKGESIVGKKKSIVAIHSNM
jgi:hypothetical protein